VRVAPFTTGSVELTLALGDVTAHKDALALQAEAAVAAKASAAASAAAAQLSGAASDPFAVDAADAITAAEGPQPPAGPQLVVTYKLVRRDELAVTYTHVSAEGAPLLRATRILQRREAPEQRAMAEVTDAARIQHACTLMVARRAAADELKAAFWRRVAARRARRAALRLAQAEARRRAAAALEAAMGRDAAAAAWTAVLEGRGPGGRQARGGSAAGRVGSRSGLSSESFFRDGAGSTTSGSGSAGRPVSASRSSGDADDDDALADGVQCVLM
jgi:hypothetical protein